MKGENVDKLADFLNALTKEYIEKGLEKKNMVTTRTIAFIDNELKGISDSLNLSEKALKEFKTRNGIMSLDEESKQVFERWRVAGSESRTDGKVKISGKPEGICRQKHQLDELIIPSSMGVEDDC